jgi:hypothetical protein
MPATQKPQQSDQSDDEPIDSQPAPVPDEDGPHDVPDDQVIEKTLPTSSTGGDRGRPS